MLFDQCIICPQAARSTEDKYHPDSRGLDESGDTPYDGDRMAPHEGEPDFVETNCRWADCDREYETQDELVRVWN